MTNCGVQSIGINCPMFKEGDNLIDIVVENEKNLKYLLTYG